MDIEGIFHSARELDGPKRAAFVDEACRSSPDAKARVLALLKADGATEGFLESRRSATESVGPYVILGVLGQGAQATVYRARHESLGRTVALKVLRHLPGSELAARRFRREAEVTAKLEHPDICRVYEVGESNGALWIAMQFVPGHTLAQQLADPSREVDTMQAVEFVERVARALHVAHENGLVHRDVKPGNLMVTDEGNPVILDFGIAHAADAGPGLTRTADVLGTPYYMAPEQLRSGTVDRRADVHALGVTLFEWLTGRRPFDGASLEAVYQSILDQEPPTVRDAATRVPNDLEIVVQAALEKDPARRYQTALAFADDLRRVRRGEPIVARRISAAGKAWRLARRYPAVTASLAVAIVSLTVGLGAALSSLRDADAALEREREARIRWYDDLSRAVAAEDLRGQTTSLQRQLETRGLAMIEADVPGFRARLDAIRVPGPYRNVLELTRQRGDALHAVRERLSPASRLCASDWFHMWTRVLMSESLPSDPTHDAAIVRFAQASVDELGDREAADLRVLRARILLLDALLSVGDFTAAASRAEAFLSEDDQGSNGFDTQSLYESRLGVALLHANQPEQARPMLERSVAVVAKRFPHTFIAFGAQANLLILYDALGEQTLAEPLRDELCRAITAATNTTLLTTLTHWMPYCVRAAIGAPRSELFDWVAEGLDASSARDLTASDVDSLLARLDELKGRLAIEPSDPVHGLIFFVPLTWGDQLRLRRADPGLTLRCYRSALELARRAPASRQSELFHTLLSMTAAWSAREAGGEQQAETLFAEALSQAPPRDPIRATVCAQYGRHLRLAGRFPEAESRLREAHELALTWHGPTAPTTRAIVRNLIMLYETWDRPVAADRWRQQLR